MADTNIENKTIKITISGGVLQDVENLPEGWNYELNDLDNQEAETNND